MRKLFLLLVCVFSLAGCGGGGGGETATYCGDIKYGIALPDSGDSSVNFWASDFRECAPGFPNNIYSLKADRVDDGKGIHCHIYLERGAHVDNAHIANLIDLFDNKIYPKVRAAYGDEPNPGIDNDSKVYILLLDIKDDWNGTTIPGYVAGYFHVLNQLPYEPKIPFNYSNEKEILYVDIHPGTTNPLSSDFTNLSHTMAHEFQHMIHWNNAPTPPPSGDDLFCGAGSNTWLNEAMSEVAPFYAFGDIGWSRVADFESGTNHSNSLTHWGPNNNGNATLADYDVVYMWGQYMADRFDQPSIDNYVFRNILGLDRCRGRGKASVEKYLSKNSTDFASVFRDWSLAVFFGDNNAGNPVSTNNPAWKYNTINTWPGLFNDYGNLSIRGLRPLNPWSLGYYWKNTPVPGSLVWGGSAGLHASFYNRNSMGIITFELDMLPGYPYAYDNFAYLILQNAQDSSVSSTGQSVSPVYFQAFSTQPTAFPTPAEKLRAFSQSTETMSAMSRGGAVKPPVPVCIHDILSWQTEEMMRKSIDTH
ncbi:MAG: hypothetical protein FWF95_02285 [Syntrophorhabdaceae bacterium]|nr:hypothetical protein [Syntrophorhabdaceae bacterium]